MDDRVIGDRFRKREVVEVDPGHTRVVERPRLPSTGAGAREVLAIVLRVSRGVLLLLAVAVVLGILFTVAPSNAENVIVRNVLSLARDAAGPFADVFTVNDAEGELVVNYAFAAAVYFAVSVVVGKLPGAKR